MPESPSTVSRDLLIAWAHLPFLTPPRLRRLRELTDGTYDVRALTAEHIAEALRLGIDEARLTLEPLRVPELARRTAAARETAITALDDGYPPLLREIADPPAALFCAGDAPLLAAKPSVAIVGTRRPTPYGVNVTRVLTRELARAGLTIVSGLARGIDSVAHDEAIAAGGRTVAVLGTGLDVLYPKENRRRFDAICANGAVVTEFPPGTAPHARNFPVRNRIIAGMSLGTVVVEAAERSGSLITARLACEGGREVFAVPGSFFSDRSAGPHALIQHGAKLVTSVDDILDELSTGLVAPRTAPAAEPEGLLALLRFDEPLHIDVLCERSGIAPAAIAARLLELELEGAIRAVPGGRYVRSP